MSEYTFETAALKAVTIDAVKYNEEGLRNSIAPETIQAVAPLKWNNERVVFGEGAISEGRDVSLGKDTIAYGSFSVAAGFKATAYHQSVGIGGNITSQMNSVGIGRDAYSAQHSVACGFNAKSNMPTTVTLGSQFIETASDGNVTHTCTTQGTGSITIGAGANTKNNGDIESSNSVTIGCKANTTAPDSITLGAGASNTNSGSILIGSAAKSEGDKALTITLGSQFTETTDDGDITHTCSTEGTGSITIGAGANTLNTTKTVDGVETTVESSNSVTIGCKAENKGADSVVIGAQAKGKTASIAIGVAANGAGGISIGANSVAVGTSIAIGKSSQISGNMYSVSLGDESSISGANAVAVGYRAKAKSALSVAVGSNATVSDLGAVVFRSTASDGTYTQLYFSGANTPLANTYEDGEAMMGYVVTNDEGNIMMDAEGNALVGTQKLSVLFPNNRGENAFTPTVLNLDEGWTPKLMFRPSDLDLPIEEPEVEEPENIEPAKPLVYKSQPVYPIVEPEIEEINE